MRFQAPQLGALGVAYTTMRLAQFVSLVVIIGLTGHFIDEIVVSQREIPQVLVGTIAVSSISVLYVMISYILYYDSLLPLLVGSGVDFLMLIAVIVVAALVGKPGPLSLLNCSVLPAKNEPAPQYSTMTYSVNNAAAPSTVGTSNVGASYATAPSTSYGITSLPSNYAARAIQVGSLPPVNLLGFYGQDQPHCYEIKTIWGLSIALCVLFAFSSIVSAGLWRRIKGPSAAAAPKDIEG